MGRWIRRSSGERSQLTSSDSSDSSEINGRDAVLAVERAGDDLTIELQHAVALHSSGCPDPFRLGVHVDLSMVPYSRLLSDLGSMTNLSRSTSQSFLFEASA